MNLTKQIKSDWLSALKSGTYKQGFAKLKMICESSYCCLGVLACVLKKEITLDGTRLKGYAGYEIFEELMGKSKTGTLFYTNDNDMSTKGYPCDYSNVIPLIEKLPTID